MKRLSNGQFDILAGLTFANPNEAHRILLIYEREYASDPNLQENLGAFFIDVGSALRDTSIIQRGVDDLETKRRKGKGVLSGIHYYNLGNGYYALEIAKRKPGYVYDPANTTMVRAKHCYREALKNADEKSKNWQTELNINYANCLAELGRSVEAITQYNVALKINPNHPMALGSLAKELEKFAHIASDSSLLEDALHLFDHALIDERLERAGYGHMRLVFMEHKRRIEARLEQLNRKRHGEHKTPRITTQYHKAFVEFNVEHGLFLNFCLKGHNCNHPYEDNIGFSITTPIGNDSIFHRLARTINEIKETFAIARLLLFEAFDSPYQTKFYDEVTRYIDILDYSVYGVRSAKLKLSFKSAYNILDRIASFINEYLNLGIPLQAVGPLNIWKKQPKDNSLRQEVTKCENFHLYGLYDIARDLSKDDYLLPLKELRDSLTHIYLVPHIFQDGDWYVTSDHQKYHIGYKEFLDHTITLMQIVRAAVIYLVAFIDEEERKRMAHTKSLAISLGGRMHNSESSGPKDSLI